MSHTPTRILLVEDEAEYARLLGITLTANGSNRFEITAVGQLSEAIEHLGKTDFDVVLLDLTLPDGRGLDTYKAISAAAPSVPVVVLSGLNDEALAVQAVQSGAQDYLVKGQSDQRCLERAIRYAVERTRIEQRLRQSEKLEAVSTFAAAVAHEVKNPLQTVVLGIDFFNEHVHTDDCGKAILKQMSEALKRADAIIQGLLEFSAYRKRNLEDQNVSEVILQSLAGFEPELAKNSIQKICAFADQLPMVRLDKRTMQHVFITLLTGVIQEIPRGGVLKVGTFKRSMSSNIPGKPDSRTRSEVVVEIEGQGKNGVTETKSPGAQSNFRLMVSKKIVELYGGRVEYNHREGADKYAISFNV